jgi:hypothetical protein
VQLPALDGFPKSWTLLRTSMLLLIAGYRVRLRRAGTGLRAAGAFAEAHNPCELWQQTTSPC